MTGAIRFFSSMQAQGGRYVRNHWEQVLYRVYVVRVGACVSLGSLGGQVVGCRFAERVFEDSLAAVVAVPLAGLAGTFAGGAIGGGLGVCWPLAVPPVVVWGLVRLDYETMQNPSL